MCLGPTATQTGGHEAIKMRRIKHKEMVPRLITRYIYTLIIDLIDPVLRFFRALDVEYLAAGHAVPCK